MISPLEMQGTIQRTQDISQIKMNEDNKPQFQHVSINTEQKEQNIQKHENVNKKDNADESKSKYDAKEKGNGTYYSKNKKKPAKKEDGKVMLKDKGSFDIFI